MDCPNCIQTAGRGRRGSITLLKIGVTACATGDCDRLQCPSCRAIFFFEIEGREPQRRPGYPGQLHFSLRGRPAGQHHTS